MPEEPAVPEVPPVPPAPPAKLIVAVVPNIVISVTAEPEKFKVFTVPTTEPVYSTIRLVAPAPAVFGPIDTWSKNRALAII